MKNIHLIILYFCFLFASLSSSYNMNYYKSPFNECMKNADETLKKTSIAYLSEQAFGFPALNDFKNSEFELDIEYMFAVCVCRESFDTVFFTIPSFVYGGMEYVVLCVINENSFASLGIYDNHELYDLLLSQQMENYPSSVLGAEQTRQDDDESGCYDFDGYPTKSVFGQKTCILEAERYTNVSYYEYSGPMTADLIYQFSYNDVDWYEKSVGSCFTTLNDSKILSKPGCHFMNDPKFSKVLCCCPYGSQICRDRDDNLLCFYGDYPVTDRNFLEGEVFFNQSIKGCTIQMTASIDNSSSSLQLKVSYGHQTEICEREVTTQSKVVIQTCSSKAIEVDNLIINGCCNETNFCQLYYLPKDGLENLHIPIKCTFKPYLAYYSNFAEKCHATYDLIIKGRVFVYNQYNCDFMESTNKEKLQINDAYELMFIKITKVDECNPQNYNDTHLNKIHPFIRFNCNTSYCDKVVVFDDVVNSLSFKCQILKSTELKLEEINETLIMVNVTATKDRWICYVKIEQRDGNLTFIEAGHLDINDKRTCMNKNISDSDYCCLNNYDNSQMNSTCNVQSMLAQYEKALKQNSTTPPPYSIRNQNNIKCIMNDIANDDSPCPANDGCFETRNMDASSTYAEPAGCLGLAEEYILKLSPEASYSLACRSIENFGHCSVVYNPDGQQKIVCCCNQVNGNLCETNMANVELDIGRTVHSFRSVSIY